MPLSIVGSFPFKLQFDMPLPRYRPLFCLVKNSRRSRYPWTMFNMVCLLDLFMEYLVAF